MTEYNPFPEDPFKDFFAQNPTGGSYGKEVPDTSRLPSPVILHGIYAFTAASLKESFEATKHLVDIDEIKITPEFSMGEEYHPAIQIGVSGLKIEHSGFHPAHPYQDHESEEQTVTLISTGQLSFNIFSLNVREAIIIQDFLTQLILLNIVYGDRFTYPGATNRDYIAMGFQPGGISWSGVSKQSLESNEEGKQFTTQGTIDFRAEHSASYGLKRVSGVSIEAIPLEYIAYLS